MSALKHIAISLMFAVGLAATAVGGWYGFFAIPVPISTGAGIATIICLFAVWVLLLVFLAMGMILAQTNAGEGEIVIAVPVGMIVGVIAGGSIAAHIGLCFGGFTGILAGTVVTWLRHRLMPRKRIERGFEVVSTTHERMHEGQNPMFPG